MTVSTFEPVKVALLLASIVRDISQASLLCSEYSLSCSLPNLEYDRR